MSISNYREAKETGVALRMQYPDDGAGCDCKDGQCSPSCPCVKVIQLLPCSVKHDIES